MNLSEIEKTVTKIQNNLFKKSNSFSLGMLKSHFRGAGLQFKEHQVYVPGDDIRFIDWNLSAKTSSTFIKTFEEERNVEIHVVIDLSLSLFFGYKEVSKFQMALDVASLLYLLTDKTHDQVSVTLFHEEILILPPLSGRLGITALVTALSKLGYINELGKITQNENENLSFIEDKKLQYIKTLVAKKKEVVLLSDMQDISKLDVFEKLIARENLHFFHLQSPLDKYENKSYSLFAKNSENKKGHYLQVKSEKKKLNKKLKWKELDVSSNYLDDFVKDML